MPRLSKLWTGAALLTGVLLGGLAVHFSSTRQPAQPVALATLPSPGVTFNFSGLYGPPADPSKQQAVEHASPGAPKISGHR